MFFSQYSIGLYLQSILVAVTALTAMLGCAAEDQESAARPQGVELAAANLTTESGLQTLQQTVHQQEFRFHGVVKGDNSYTETAFKPGKIIQLNVKEGERVAANKVIAVLYSPTLAEKLQQTQATLKRAQAQFRLDQASLARNQQMYDKKVMSLQEFAVAKRDFETAHQAVKEAQVAVNQATNEFADASIKTNEAGIVSTIYKREGDFVTPGSPIYRFESTTKQQASFQIPEKFAISMTSGDRHTLFVPSMNKTLTGTVAEKSLPTQDGVRLHGITFDIEALAPELLGLHIVLRYQSAATLAYKVDYRAIRYDVDNQPYLIQVGQRLTHLPIAIVDMNTQSVLITADVTGDNQILIGHEASIAMNLHQFKGQ